MTYNIRIFRDGRKIGNKLPSLIQSRREEIHIYSTYNLLSELPEEFIC